MRYGLIGLLVVWGLFSSCGLTGLERRGVQTLMRPSVAMAQTEPLVLGQPAGTREDGLVADCLAEEETVDDAPRSDSASTVFAASTRLELTPEVQLTKKFGRLPGEFRHQAALLLGCRELLSVAPGVLVGIAEAACGRVPILALVSDDENRAEVISTLEDHGLPSESVYFIDVPHDTMWIRDYGPVVTTTSEGSEIVLNADYGDEERLADDQVPAALARLLGAPCVRVPFEMDGGNLLSNGEGLCLSTVQLLVDNDFPELRLRQMLRTYYGCDQTIFLEPLVGEETGHVDMFATFTAPDTVVLGEYSEDEDEENKQVLDRNFQMPLPDRDAPRTTPRRSSPHAGSDSWPVADVYERYLRQRDAPGSRVSGR